MARLKYEYTFSFVKYHQTPFWIFVDLVGKKMVFRLAFARFFVVFFS